MRLKAGLALVLLALVCVLPGQAAPGDITWTSLASTFTARQGAAAAIVNGKAFVVGGFNAAIATNQGYLAAVEQYDPTTRIWLSRTPMSRQRNRLGLAALTNGELYAIGGSYGQGGTLVVTNEVERYDPNTNAWTARAAMPTGREAPGVVNLNGRIYAIGGSSGTCCSGVVEEYDPLVNQWRARTSLTVARWALAAAVSGGRIYAIGGSNGGTTYYGNVDEYDAATNTWTARAAMTTSRHSAAVATAPNSGRIYVAGGSNATIALSVLEEYDPSGDVWAARATLPIARTGASMVAGSDNKLYLFGGIDPNGQAITQIDVYDPIANTWTTPRSLPTPREDLAMAVTGANRIFAVGGVDATTQLATLEELDPATGLWTTRTSMTTARRSLGLAYATNGRLYAIGGFRSTGVTGVTEEYNPTSDSWSSRATMPTARQELGVASTLSGRVYAIGGKDALSADLATVEEYNPSTNAWVTREDMPTARSGLAVATASNGRVYAAGGIGADGYLTTVEEYDPNANTWSALPNLTVERTDLALVASADAKLYAIGGQNADGSLATVEMLDLNRLADGWQLKEALPVARHALAAVLSTNGRLFVVAGSNSQLGLRADVDQGSVEPAAGSPATSTPTAVATATPAPDPWPQFGHDPRHTGRSSSRLPGAVTQRWRYQSGLTGGVQYGPVVAPDGTVYAAGGGYVLAIGQNGAAKWRFPTGTAAGPVAVASDGTVYATGADVGTVILYALAADGLPRWTQNITDGFPAIVPIPSLGLGPDGNIYVGVQTAESETTYHSFSPNGLALWPNPPRVGPVVAEAPVVGVDGFVYVSLYQENGYIEQISSAGDVVARTDTLGFVGGSAAMGSDETLYAGSSNGIFALNPRGLIKWSYVPHAPVGLSTPAVGADGSVYIGVGSRLYALSPTGQLKWASESCIGGGAINGAPAIGADGSIVFHMTRSGGTISAALCAVDETGLPRWRFVTQAGGEPPLRVSSPAIGGDGLVYVGSPGGSVYALQGAIFRGIANRVLVPLAPRLAGS